MNNNKNSNYVQKNMFKTLLRKFMNHPLKMLLKSFLQLNISFVMVGVFSLAISSIITFIIGLMEFCHYIWPYINHHFLKFIHVSEPMHNELTKEVNAVLCQILETNLIGVILFISAVGLYYLFWEDIMIPAWLRFKNINKLKEYLVGIIITVLGVSFLEHALAWKHPDNLLKFGGAISLIIIVLVLYSKVLSGEHHYEHPEE